MHSGVARARPVEQPVAAGRRVEVGAAPEPRQRQLGRRDVGRLRGLPGVGLGAGCERQQLRGQRLVTQRRLAGDALAVAEEHHTAAHAAEHPARGGAGRGQPAVRTRIIEQRIHRRIGKISPGTGACWGVPPRAQASRRRLCASGYPYRHLCAPDHHVPAARHERQHADRRDVQLHRASRPRADEHKDGFGIAFFEDRGRAPASSTTTARASRRSPSWCEHYPIKSRQRHRPHPQGDAGPRRAGEHASVRARAVGPLLGVRAQRRPEGLPRRACTRRSGRSATPTASAPSAG